MLSIAREILLVKLYLDVIVKFMLKVRNRNNRKRYEICSKLTISVPQSATLSIDVFIIKFEHISYIFLVLYC